MDVKSNAGAVAGSLKTPANTRGMGMGLFCGLDSGVWGRYRRTQNSLWPGVIGVNLIKTVVTILTGFY